MDLFPQVWFWVAKSTNILSDRVLVELLKRSNDRDNLQYDKYDSLT